jgi:putative FmdB family regulatory protein
MPIYTYKCNNCKHEFEDNRKIDDRFWNDPCPNCEVDAYGNISLIIKQSPKIVRESGDVLSKTDSSFRENMRRIKKHHPRNTIKVK